MTNKALSYIFVLIALAFTACSDEATQPGYDEVMVSLSPQLPISIESRASNEGGLQNIDWTTHKLRHTLKVYDSEGKNIATEAVTYCTNAQDAAVASINVTLTAGRTYRFAVWTDFVKTDGTAYYDTSKFPEISEYNHEINNEARDAYFGITTQDVNSTSTVNVNLTRPFAKLRIVDENSTDGTPENVSISYSEVSATGINIFTGELTGTASTKTYSASTCNFSDDATSSKTLLVDYIWADNNGTKSTVKFTPAGDFPEKEIADVPLQRNKLTTIKGSILATGECTVTLTNGTEYALHIGTAEELTDLITKGTTSTTIHICADIDLGGKEFTSVAGLPAETYIAGINKKGDKTFTIKNLSINGASALFGNTESLTIENLNFESISVTSSLNTGTGIVTGNATGLTANNITLSNCSASGTQKVGLLAGAVYNSATLTNCDVTSGTVAATSGQSAPLVGFVGRASATDRTTSANFSLSDCDATGTTVNSSMNNSYDNANGMLVGCFNGYDYNEVLTFSADCSATNVTLATQSVNSVAYTSPFVEGNEGQWLQDNDYTALNNLLGGEVYCRGTVNLATTRFIPRWDGVRTVSPLVENGVKLIYSAPDLAKLQGAGHSAVTFKENVDLASFKYNPIGSITNLDGENNTLYNLKVDMVHDNVGAGFIKTTSGTTTHKNIIFDGANIKNVHNPAYGVPAYGNTNDGGAGNAYAGTLTATCYGTYTVENVHARNGKVYAVCKMGGLVGAEWASTFKMTGCSVDNYTIENYAPGVPNYYTLPSPGYMDMYLQQFQDNSVTNAALAIMGIHKIPEYGRVNLLQWWYTQGEAGGLIGFVKSSQATIDNCSVTNTKINCEGQPNKPAVANVWDKNDFDVNNPFVSGKKIFAKGSTDIAGRHVNQFIGDVVSARSSETGTDYVVTISDYEVSGNSYNGTTASSTNQYSHNYATNAYCEVVGCAYYVGVDVGLGSITLKHVNDYAGTLIFNAKGSASVTITEAAGKGNEISWTGGSFSDMEYQQGRDKIGGSWWNPTYGPWYYKTLSEYPDAP